jgi:hypothetical protein
MSEERKDRFVNRRKMAWRSFYAFSALGSFLILLGLWRPGMVTGVWPQAMFVLGLWASVVGAYFGVTYGTDQNEIKKEPTDGPL